LYLRPNYLYFRPFFIIQFISDCLQLFSLFQFACSYFYYSVYFRLLAVMNSTIFIIQFISDCLQLFLYQVGRDSVCSCADCEGTNVVRPSDYFNCSMLTFQIRMLISYCEPASLQVLVPFSDYGVYYILFTTLCRMLQFVSSIKFRHTSLIFTIVYCCSL
jgi:hypothetical protein